MPSVWELHYGAACTGSEAEHRRVRDILLMYPPVVVDEEIARRAAELLAEADRRADGPSGVDSEDGLTAAVADPVLTDDERDFGRLGVPYEAY